MLRQIPFLWGGLAARGGVVLRPSRSNGSADYKSARSLQGCPSTLCLFLTLIAPALAQKKPITVATLAEFELAAGKQAGPATWAPDGKSFVFERGKTLMI